MKKELLEINANDHLLVKKAKEKAKGKIDSKSKYTFLDDVEIDDEEEKDFLSNLELFPHAFFLGGLMDKQISAKRAWHIPYVIKQELGTFDINDLSKIPLESYKEIFHKYKLHRFNDIQAGYFLDAVKRIIDTYNGDISKIWSNCPSSSKVVYDFLQFNGCGVKISTMLTNMLARDFHIEFSDYYSIDVSPDVHVQRIMKRTGLIEAKADVNSVIYKARELNPEYPGIIDYACWEIGKNICHNKNPKCDDCPLSSVCMKVV